MKKDFLLEVLVQELPYKFIPSAIVQLKSSFENLFKSNGLDFEKIEVLATPRRLAVIVQNLDEVQNTVSKDVKGPILSIAKKEDGTFSPAALGFAKKNGVSVDDLYEKDNYIFAKIEIKGKTTPEILKENIENLILKLQGSHFMRWADNTEKFSRPIENIVAIFGNKVVDLSILDVKSSNKTKGHRYSKIKEVVIDEPKNYVELLRKANVIVNQEERKNLIVSLAEKCAKENNLTVRFNEMEELLEEVTFITEYPVAVLCNFDEKYLQIPSIVTTTVMTSHQRYFPLWDEKSRLSNYFITMANYVGSDFSNIQAGNQRVIAARLEDGVFFYNEDTKTKLIDKIDNLKGMTFQKGLGTLFDKTNRIIKLSEKLSEILNIKDTTDILRCAKLSKCDLSTKLVFEFTELQGFIGEDYARKDGEKETVARGIAEHYFPLGANGELPQELCGQIVSIADKIDTICALFISTQKDKKKKRPTGSNDPLGARRAAIGILRIALENNLSVNFEELLKYSLDLLSKEFSIEQEETLLDELKEFFIARLMFMYEKDFSANTIKAIEGFNPLENLSDFIQRAKIITDFQKQENFGAIKENATRIQRILKNGAFNEVNENLFVLDEEKALYKAAKEHKADEKDLKGYINSLNVLIEPVVKFFDKVLVMDKDEKIKNNRLALLNILKQKFDLVCDFEKV